jgi:hypothetical protein
MFCAHCGAAAQADSRFCGQCGAPLLAPDVTSNKRSTGPVADGVDVALEDQPATPASAPTRKQQLQGLKLELKRLKLELREINAQLSQVRSQYQQGAPFAPYGMGRRVYREVENLQLLQPQQRKQALQQQIFRLEEHILALESEADDSNRLPQQNLYELQN